MASLGYNRYGKCRVRLLKVFRREDGWREVTELETDLLLRGTFSKAFLSDDNSEIVPTDTVKNTVLALGYDGLASGGAEDFALLLGRHFLERYAHVDEVQIEMRERPWRRLAPDGTPHPHGFDGDRRATPFVRLTAPRTGEGRLSAGVRDWLLMKATASGFVGYHQCDLTTLPPTEDRVLATSMAAEWTFLRALPGPDFAAARRRIETALVEKFLENYSPSVQRTLFEMGERALAVAPEIGKISLAMPNKHYIAPNMTPLGRANGNLFFVPFDEPHGQIEAEVTR